MKVFRSKMLIAAKALSAKDWSHPKVIQAARHMAHEGATLSEIMTAIGWKVSRDCANKRFRKFNIRPFNPTDCAHAGFNTGLGRRGDIADQRSYRPRGIGA